MSWKKVLVASMVGCSLMGTSFAAWQEKEVAPILYEKVEYEASGNLFWLQNFGETMPSEYFQLNGNGKIKLLPVGKELASKSVRSVFWAGKGKNPNSGKDSNQLLLVHESGQAKKLGLIDLEGKVVVEPFETKTLGSYYQDRTLRTDQGIYKDGALVTPYKKGETLYRIYGLDDSWESDKTNVIVNHKGEPIFELPYVKGFDITHPDFVTGESNGKDGKPKAYRIWNWKQEEITPVAEGFKSAVVLRSWKKAGVDSNEAVIDGVFGRTDAGWAIYPYEGNGKFGTPIPVANKDKEYSGAKEKSLGYYDLWRTGENTLLDFAKGKVYPKTDDVVAGGTRLVQEELVESRSFIAIPIIGSGSFAAVGGTIKTNERMRYRILDEKGQKIIELWETIHFGEKYMMNRRKSETGIYDYDGKVILSFKSAKEGYIPFVGKYGKSGELDEDVTEKMSWENWPGAGKYQPYFVGGNWGILDMETAKEYLAPDQKFGRIVKVSEDGKQFWSIVAGGEGKGRKFGIKQFELVQ